ncbi:uncharacterized protein LOC105688827 [Athalia rosae]|uniref:uncharacterized protein LOC105688827 n=1 Tax=Athalia rosae TaxID=37344 RepID=UPI002033E2C9|nr:uncharacterized protein LOC105688827 [Athalia rosae]
MNITVTLLVLCTVMVTVSSAGILDSLFSWGLAETEARSTTPPSKCLCQTSGCLCCVDLNLTSAIDLGGPACLNIKQREENVTLNMSFGDNPMHNATIRIAQAANKRTCMDLLSDLAQICATFTSVKEAVSAGHDGCLAVEPALLGTTQAVYPIGCFNFNQGSIRQLDTTVVPVETPETPESSGSAEEEDYNLNTEELIAAVSESAEQGFAMFSQWLGLNLTPKNQTSGPTEIGGEDVAEENGDHGGSSRTSRKLGDDAIHQRDGSDERFKQILSAQDNIQKESPRIGQSSGVETTYVYTAPSRPGHLNSVVEEAAIKEPEVPQGHLAVVPRESRRGGRAYNIHQHVNEI